MIDTARAALITLTNMPGYAVLIDIFELQVARLEQAVLETNPAKESEVLAAHRVAVGARWAFEEGKKAVDREVSAKEGEKPLTQKEMEELYIKSLQ